MLVPSPPSILVVDDQARNLVALQAVLASADYGVVTARSGADALGCVLDRDFAVIVLDVHMPEMDGFETASLIRARDRSQSTPIIFLTADDREGPRVQEGYRLGAVDYLYKPFDTDILRAKVAVFVELFRKSLALERRTAELTHVTAALARREQQVVALNTELEERVSERTAALEVAIGNLKREAAERKRAEETLKETQQRLRTVVNNSPIVLFAVDEQGIFTLFEGYGLGALGMQPGQIVGQSVLLPAEHVLSTSPGAAQLIRSVDVRRALGGETFTAIVEAFASVFELQYSPNLDSDGALVGAVGIAADVSERRALDRRKDEFVSTVSHELRTPLNGIIAVSQLLLSTALDASQLEYVQIIDRSGQALRRLINDVLTLARYESGKVALEILDLDVRLVLEDVTALLLSPARDKGIDIVAHIDPGVPRGLRGDAGRLRQVLLNLAGNALKFTDTGGIVLQALVDPGLAARLNVRFEITDTGIGIAPEVQERLFRPFEQADSSTTTRYGGTGLGLAICRELVESMGGQIGVDSTAGNGCTFWFVLPLERLESTNLSGGADLEGPSVVIACDAPVRAAALAELVSGWSMLSTTAATAAEAITLVGQGIARGQAFDAIVIALEDVSGAGALLARTLGERTDGLSPHVILVAPPDQSPAISLQAPGWTTIPSPVGPAQLFDALAQLFRAGGQDGYSTAHSPVDIHATPPRSGERILVVEDVPLNQLVAQRALEYLGYRPVIADRGQVALRLLDESQFAIVLMDCRMPEMDGLEATRIIRQREAANGQRRIPIIGLTASAQDSDRKSCFDAGMDDYMSKPLDLVELARMLHRWTTGIELATTFEPAALPIQDFTGSTAVLDPTALAMIRTLQPPDDTDLLTEVIENFLDAAPTYLTQLTRAHQCGDYEEMTDAAHILKSAAAYVGARAVQELCRLVESCARSRVPDGVETLIDSLRTALREARVALAAELADQDVAA